MNKTALLAAAAAVALTAGGASAVQHPAAGVSGGKINPVFRLAKGAKILYNQNSDTDGVGIDSQNFTSGTFSPTNNDQGADDFVVPKTVQWTVTQVDVSGLYFNGNGPAASENVTFYANNKGVPGSPVKNGTFTGLKGTDSSGSFSISLGKKGVSLKSGTYWVSVVANCWFENKVCGQWGWAENGTIHGDDAMWQNPSGGFGVCQSWGTVADCFSGTPAGDFAFDLQGKSKKS